jgi:TolB-like protein
LRSRLVLLALLVCAAPFCVADARAEERVRVALLPLVVHATEGRDYLQRGLADMLVSRLGRQTRIAVVPVDDPKLATTDVDSARKTGVANEAEFVVFGSFTRFGAGASLELSCAPVRDPERTPANVSTHARSMAELIPLLDGVAERVAFQVLGDGPGGTGVSTPPSDTEAEPVR